MKRLTLLLAGAIGCNSEQATAPLAATIIRRTDTVTFELPVALHRCDDRSDVLLQGLRSGDGVLLLLRAGDSLTGVLPIVGYRDTITRPAAVVAIRYYRENVVHAFSLDSGAVTITDSGGSRSVAVAGSGMEVALGVRSSAAVRIASLPAPAESTMSCTPVP